MQAVQQVMANLLISHIELRSEDSIDIRPYTHERKVDKIVVPMGEELNEIRLKYIQVILLLFKQGSLLFIYLLSVYHIITIVKITFMIVHFCQSQFIL